MPIEDVDFKLFEIIYANHAGQPWEFIQEQLLKAKEALLVNDEIITRQKEINARVAVSVDSSFIPLSKADLVIKSRADIDAAIGDDTITCCICGRSFKSLGAHLKRQHKVDPEDYRRVCGYPADTSLMSRNYLKTARSLAINAISHLPRNRATSEETGEVTEA